MIENVNASEAQRITETYQGLSLQEIRDKTKIQAFQINEMLDKNYFDRTENNIYMTPNRQLKHDLQYSFRNISLREFLIKSGTIGIAGAAYLVAQKVSDDLYTNSMTTDRCPQLSVVVDGWEGSDLQVTICNNYNAQMFGSGGSLPTETFQTTLSTAYPKGFGVNINMSGDLIEDAQPDILENHLKLAGRALGRKATSLLIAEMLSPQDGVGNANTATAGADTTTSAQLMQAAGKTGVDGYLPDTVLTTHESLGDAIITSIPTSAPRPGFDTYLNCGFDVVVSNDSQLWTDSSGAMVDCKTVVFSRNDYMLTARKRWARIENWDGAIRNLKGATVTARQDSVSMFKDAGCKLSES